MMLGLWACLLGIRWAIVFLTRIPISVGSEPCLPTSSGSEGAARIPDERLGLNWAAAHLPFVGTLIGVAGALVWRLSSRFEAGIRAWLVIAVLLLMTGALHEDGLADTADALGGAFERTKLFVILKDSRIGTYGTVALIGVLCLRALLFTQLLSVGSWVIVVSQTVSRFAPVVLMRWLPYVTPPDASRSRDMVQVNNAQVAVAALWTLFSCMGIVYFAQVSVARFLLALGAQAAACTWLAFRFKRRAGGITGDFLGATQQVGELAFLLGLAWAA
jgi:adenosylcobinamide-GDP ribazoletransferase